MSEAPTPQDVLDIASATTHRARTAPALSSWVPPVAALLCFGFLFLFGYTVEMFVDATITLAGVAGIVATAAFIAFMVWQWRTWRSGGVVPRLRSYRSGQRWKQVLLGWLPPFIGVSVLGGVPGWPTLAGAVITSVWLWFQLAPSRTE